MSNQLLVQNYFFPYNINLIDQSCKQPTRMTHTNEEIGLLIIGIMKLITYLVFLAAYMVRINKLDKMASNAIEKDRSLKLRVAGVCTLIFLDALHIILSYSDPYYFQAPFANYSLINLLAIFDLLLQIYIITRQYKKKTRRSRSVVVLWILMAIQEVSTIVIVEAYAPNSGVALPIAKIIISSILIVVTFLVEPPVEASLENLQASLYEPRLPILSETNSIYAKKNQNIYIEFNKEFQVALKKDYYEFSFKIAVYVSNKFHIITKSEAQFSQLSKQLAEIYPGSDIVQLKNVSRVSNAINITKYGEEKQKTYESYLINLTKTNQFCAEPLLNFLQIPSTQRAILQRAKGSLLKKDTMNSQEEQKQKQPFFSVGWKDGKIYVRNSQILDFFVNKSKEQIIAFHTKLISEKRLKIDLISEDPDENELSHFIYRAANSKNLWRSFAEWMCLGSTIQDKVFNMFDFWNRGFEDLKIQVVGHETSFDQDKSIVIMYLISIKTKQQFPISSKQSAMLKKRFNDFQQLDRNIRKYIIAENMKNAHIPSLPPRFSPFESKTSPYSRRVHFDNYIKDIIKIDGINHCIKLLEFFETQWEVLSEVNQKQQWQTESQQQQRQNSQIFDGINVDDLEP